MTTAVQHRRGTTAEHAVFTGLEGEVTIDTTKDTAVIHDGSLAGGYPLAKESLANVNPGALSAITGSATAADDVFLMYDTSATSMKKITRAELNNAIEADALASVTITGGTINGTSVGASTPSTGAFTTLSTSGATTLSGGTANGVTYLNGSKVLTSGSALTFDGTNLATTGKINIGSPAATVARLNVQSSNTSLADFVNSGGTTGVFLSTDGTIPVIGSRGGDQGLRLNASGTTSTAVIMFNAGASEGMRLTSTGLGIGTSSPGLALTVAGPNDGSLQIRMGAAASPTYYFEMGRETVSTGDFRINEAIAGAVSTRMTIKTGGNVGIGTSSPAYKLQVVGGAITASRARSNTAGDMGLMIAPSDSTIQYGFRVDSNTNNLNVDSFVSGSYVTRAIIDSSGNLLVGNAVQVWDERLLVSRTTNAVVGGFYSSSASYTSSVIRAQTETAAGTGWYFFEGRAAGGSFQYGIRGNGTVATSDVRRKKNIEPARSYLQDVCSIPIVKYNWKTDEDGAPKELGWLAQDVEKVFPNMVVTHHDGPNDDQEVLLLKKEVFLPMLMKCIQEQQATITLLTARIEALEGN